MSFCPEHISGFEPSLPCPWAGCRNGIEKDTLVEHLSGSPDRITWERGALDSFDGRRRYFWHDPQCGWWEVAVQLRNHELGRVQRSVATGNCVYHYTTLPAFKNIVETQELWLTDYAYLNDASEIRHGVELARRVFDSAVIGATPETATALRGLLDLAPGWQPRVCVFCLSSARDSLTQWKGYGRDHAGVAIGIEPSAFLQGLGFPHELSPAPVIYNPEVKEGLLKGFFHDWAALRDRDCEAGNVQSSAYESITRAHFVELLSMMKDEAFSDEREFRFVFQEDPTGPIAKLRGRVAKRFRVSGDVLVPYTTTADLMRRDGVRAERQSRLVFHEIVVGPNPYAELIRNGLRELLRASGYHDVEVSLSSLPFR